MITVHLDPAGEVIGIDASNASTVRLRRQRDDDNILTLALTSVDDVERSVTIELNDDRVYILESNNARITQDAPP